MYNTIILKKGFARLTKNEMKKFEKGDTICGIDREPEELNRWSIDQEEEAKAELEKYRCSYGEEVIEEYALEYCECDEDGEFLKGSDYELAKEKIGSAIRGFLEKKFGALDNYPLDNLTVNGSVLTLVRVIGDNECFDGNEFYQYVLDDEKLYKAYFDIANPDTGEQYDALDNVDYTKAYRLEDVTEQIAV